MKTTTVHTHVWKLAALALVAVCLSAPSFAEYPTRRIQLVYPLTTGTPTYHVSQLIAEAMSVDIGAQMVAAAKPGASGADALLAALREPADGYTVIDAYVAPLIISPLFGKVAYSCKDFVPLYSATSTPLAIASRADEKRWTDFASLLKFMKAHPGQTRYSAGGELSMPHLIAAKLLQSAQLLSRHITYTDLHESAVELRDGSLDWIVINPGMYQDGRDKLRILATISDGPETTSIYGNAKRSVDYGVHMGLAGMSSKPWDWWLVKKDTPHAVVEKLRVAMAKALARPELQAQLSSLGYVPTLLGPEQFQTTCERVSTELKSATDAIEWEKAEVQKLK